MEMPPYQCCYCSEPFQNFSGIIYHCIDIHSENKIIIKKVRLCDQTGNLKYVQKDFKYVPNDTDKDIVVSEEVEKLCLITKGEALPCPPKKEKLDDELMDETEGTSNTGNSTTNDQLQMLRDMLPSVLSELQQHGLSDLFVKFNTLIFEKKFPLENIAFLLFMDVVAFYSSESACQMRYSDTVKMFWLAAYRIFHGKFLRFMGGGTKSKCLDMSSEREPSLKQLDSNINFVVPDIKTLESTSKNILANEIRPGILVDSLDILQKEYGEDIKPSMKICFDGKKINSCLTEHHGDVDLFECEPSPTLTEVKRRIKDEVDMTQRLIDSCQQTAKGCSKKILPEILETIRLLSHRVRDMREMLITKEQCLEKFKGLGKPDWRKSKYQFVISSTQTSIYQIKECINNCLETIDQLGNSCADMQNKAYLYCHGDEVNLSTQENFVCIKSVEDLHETREVKGGIQQHIVKQREKEWFEIREKGKVTGSTVYRAIGLESLKSQIKHFDSVFNHKKQMQPSAVDKKRMEYGTNHEIDAVATILGKVFPIYYPELMFYEEGCFDIQNEDESLCIVSPDGSGRSHPDGTPVIAVEIKCPFPDKKYSTQQLYTIPVYYSTQLLCEMVALNCTELLFLCYTEESSTVFRVTFSQKTWDLVWDQIILLYKNQSSKRPKQKNALADKVKSALKEYLKENVKFLCEIPSCVANPCTHELNIGSPIYLNHISCTSGRKIGRKSKNLDQILFKAQSCFREAANLCRRRATELFLFLISDVDRIHKDSVPHAFPIAYGLQGPSLTTPVVRKMFQKVLDACFERNLDVKAFSCDGQWIQLLHTDPDGKALTEIQKQKRFWESIRTFPKGKLVSFFEDYNAVPHLPTFEQVVQIGMVSIRGRTITVRPNDQKMSFQMKERHIKALMSNQKEIPEGPVNERSEKLDHALQLLPSDLSEKVDSSTYTEIIGAIKVLVSEGSEKENDLDEEDDQDVDESVQTSDCQIQLTDPDVSCILSAIQCDDHIKKQNKWSNMSSDEFRKLVTSAHSIQNNFSLVELRTTLRVLKQLYPTPMKSVLLSSSKQVLVNLCSIKIGDGTAVSKTAKVKKQAVPSLRQLSVRCIRKLPKLLLKIVFAEMNWAHEKKTWQESFPYSPSCRINDSDITLSWYSFPWLINHNATSSPMFGVVDSHHILTNLRSKCCTSGIVQCGISRTAWRRVAQDNKNNCSGLTLAHVDDLIDKQSNAFAQKTFSTEVQQCMEDNGDLKEAHFCQLIRDWYEAEDTPQISSMDRLKYRLRLRSWLLQRYDSSIFPPPGMYVKGIPIVTYEALVTSIERKIQLYAFVRGGGYNTRAVSTLDAENFFSLFEDIHPTGGGPLKPELVAKCLRNACQLMAIRFNPERRFQMGTSRAPVYPIHDLQLGVMEDHKTPEDSSTDISTMNTINVRDHVFDSQDVPRRKRKRKSGEVSRPGQYSRGAKGVREHHRRNETKILPHVRLGIDIE